MHRSKFFPAFVNFILVKLQKNDWRGKHKFYTWIAKRFAHKVIFHTIDSRSFCVPVGEWCFWLDKGPENYYLDEFIPFCNVLNQLGKPFTFFDLGADIGSVSSLVVTHCPNLANIVAFEPNSKAFELLQHNLSQTKLASSCVNQAVSNFEGKVSFNADPERLNDHEGAIDSSVEGDTPVTSLNLWYETQGPALLEDILVFKIDVEGQEIQAIQGAEALFKKAKKVVVLIEIHPDVLEKTGHSADDLFVAAESVMPFRWLVPLYKNQIVDRKKALFTQIPQGQYDIIGVSE